MARAPSRTRPTRTSGRKKRPEEDVSVSGTDDLTVIQAIRAYKAEAEAARRTRIKKNQANRQAYMGLQDWSHKMEGQSREFIPRTSVAVEQFVAFFKRALTQFGSWYEVSLGRESKSPISAVSIQALMDCFLRKTLTNDNRIEGIDTILTDALKVGCLESLVILKVHGNMVESRSYEVKPGDPFVDPATGNFEAGGESLISQTYGNWRLRIDIVKAEDYYPDPTGAGLYEIHETEVDLSYVLSRAEEGVYDKGAVSALVRSMQSKQKYPMDRRPQEHGHDESTPPSFRKRVVLQEFWGNILDSSGKVVERNVFCTIANDLFVIRKPTPNPFWHQKSPFIARPLMRVPHSVWHKAIYDEAVQLNMAINEMFNLILDGGLSSVWGVRQVRVDDLEDPSQVAGGIPQGATLAVKNTLPVGGKVVEQVTEGEVPGDAMAVFEMLMRQFTEAALSNELKLGSLPPKQVKATEVVELSQSQAVTLDSLVRDVEISIIEPALERAWLTMLQHIDDVTAQDIIGAVGTRAAVGLSEMTPAQRFATFYGCCSFKVNGISAVMARVRDFQKIMALLQAIMTNPVMLLAFLKKYSPDRVLAHMMRSLNINPDTMIRDEEEALRWEKDMGMLPQVMAMMQAGSGGGTPAGAPAGSGTGDGGGALPAEINQAANPLTGMVG